MFKLELSKFLAGFGGGGGPEGGGGGGGIGWDLQHGPVHEGIFFLSLAFASLEHLTCSQSSHLVHCTDIAASNFLQTAQ